MNRLITVFALIISSLTIVNAQNGSDKVEILWGDELKESKKSSLNDIVGYDESGFYAMSSKSVFVVGKGYIDEVKLFHFDNNVKLKQERELELTLGKKDMYLEFIVQLKGKLYVFASYPNKKEEKNELYVQTLNKKTLVPNDDKKKIAEITFQRKLYNNFGGFDYSLSEDSTKILVFYQLPYEKKKNEKFGFHVFDDEMNQLWERNITLPYPDKKFRIENHQIDNFGNVHILGRRSYEKGEAAYNEKIKFNFVVLSYFKEEKDVREYDIKMEGKYLSDMNFLINDDGELICVGFYSNSGLLGADGSFYLKIDSDTKEIVLKGTKEFGLDFITQSMSDHEEKKARKKQSKGKDVELYNFYLDDIVLSDDGSIYVVGEQYFVKERTTTSTSNGRSTTKTTYTYYYNDIIVVNIDFKGDILWAEKIGKFQKSTNDGGFYSSYDLSVVGDKMYFIFNDHPDNIRLNKDSHEHKSFRRGKNAVIGMVEMDGEGNQKRYILNSEDDIEVITRPKVCEQISDNQTVIFGQKGRKQQFAIITFKD